MEKSRVERANVVLEYLFESGNGTPAATAALEIAEYISVLESEIETLSSEIESMNDNDDGIPYDFEGLYDPIEKEFEHSY